MYNRIFTFFLLCFVPYSVYKCAENPPSTGVSIVTVLFVLLTTDIISGILHIILDNKRSLDIPLLKSLAEGFQYHHDHPKNIYQISVYKHLVVMHLPLTFIFALVWSVDEPITHLAYVSLAVSLHIMQMSHRWAHTPKNKLSPLVITLQKWRLLLPPRSHGKHHNGEFDSNFSIMNGWSNFIINALVKVFGKTSHAWIPVFFVVLVSMLVVPLGF